MRRAPLPFLLTIAVLLAGTACTDDPESADCENSDLPTVRDHSTLVVEGDPWSGYALFRKEDMLDGTPYDVSYIEQLCQAARADDLGSGEADFILTSLDQYLLHQPAGSIVAVVDQSRGADALVLNTKQHFALKSIDDLDRLVRQYAADGRKPTLAYTGGSPSEMLLHELANTTEELRLSDFNLVSVASSADANTMLEQEDAQLAMLWEPDVAAARTDGYTVALSSADAPNAIIDVLVASDELMERDPEAVRTVVTRYYAQMDGYLANAAGRGRLEAALAADDPGLDAAEAKAVLAGIEFYSAEEAEAFMNDDIFPLDQPALTQSVRSIAALLALTHPDVSADHAAIDGSFVEAVAR